MTAYDTAKKAYQANPSTQGPPGPGTSGAAPLVQPSAPQAYMTPEPVLPPDDYLEPYPSPLASEPIWVRSRSCLVVVSRGGVCWGIVRAVHILRF